MSGTIHLVMSNDAEYFLRDPGFNLTGEEYDGVVQFAGTYEAEHCIFWTDAPRVLVLPEGVDVDWFADVHEALGLTPPPYITPTAATGLLVKDLLADGAVQRELRELLCGYDLVRLQVSGPTPEVYVLSAVLRGWGHEVELDCMAEEDYWVSLYLDSKVSVLDLARQTPGVTAAPGMITSNWIELRGAITAMVSRHGKVIARSAYGVAGNGTSVVTDEPGAVDAFLDRAARDSFFGFPILVQKFIEHAPGVGGPATDFLVGENGVEDIVLCAQTVEDGYHIRSTDVGDGSLPRVWADRVTSVTHVIGRVACDLGYRGWMCVDCVAGADGQLYVAEINARRSGSLHAGGLLRMWHAERDLTLCMPVLITVPAGTSYTRDIRPVFRRLWEQGVRAYPTTVRGIGWEEPMMAVIAAAPTAAEAHEIVAGLQAELNPRIPAAQARAA